MQIQPGGNTLETSEGTPFWNFAGLSGLIKDQKHTTTQDSLLSIRYVSTKNEVRLIGVSAAVCYVFQ